MNPSLDKTIENRSMIRRLTASLIIIVLIVSVIAVTAMHHIVSQAAIRGLEKKRTTHSIISSEPLKYRFGRSMTME